VKGSRRTKKEIHREKFLHGIGMLLFNCEIGIDSCERFIDEVTDEERNAGLKDLHLAISLLKRAESKLRARGARR
jgi:hypothetical protein